MMVQGKQDYIYAITNLPYVQEKKYISELDKCLLSSIDGASPQFL